MYYDLRVNKPVTVTFKGSVEGSSVVIPFVDEVVVGKVIGVHPRLADPDRPATSDVKKTINN